MWKRIAAWILDMILLAILAVGFGVILSGLLDYDGYNAQLQSGYDRYETLHGVVFDISAEEYTAKNEAEKDDRSLSQYINMVLKQHIIKQEKTSRDE